MKRLWNVKSAARKLNGYPNCSWNLPLNRSCFINPPSIMLVAHTPLDPQLLVDPSLLMLLLESFNGKMSLSLVTQQDWFFDIPERNSPGLSRNSAYEILRHRVVPSTWIHSPLTLISDGIITVRSEMHKSMQLRDHAEKIARFPHTKMCQVGVGIAKLLQSPPVKNNTGRSLP